MRIPLSLADLPPGGEPLFLLVYELLLRALFLSLPHILRKSVLPGNTMLGAGADSDGRALSNCW